MTDIELKNLKDNLWHSADMLRAGAHLAPNKYGQPILGLIFLRYADVLFKQHKAEIDKDMKLSKVLAWSAAIRTLLCRSADSIFLNVLISIQSMMRLMMPKRQYS